MTLAGFPHSGISGSTPTCGSPKLIAAYRALLRLSVPRHPPCALISLDRISTLRPGLKGEVSPGPPNSLQHTHWCSRVDAYLRSTSSTQPTTRVFNSTTDL